MAIMKITGAGMAAIAVLVAMLWVCILGERLILRQANRDFNSAMTEIRQMQRRRVVPAAVPVVVHPVRPALS